MLGNPLVTLQHADFLNDANITLKIPDTNIRNAVIHLYLTNYKNLGDGRRPLKIQVMTSLRCEDDLFARCNAKYR